MIDQRFARPVVVDDLLVKIFLLTFNLARNAGGVKVVAVAVRVGGLPDCFVVDFRAAIQSGEQVVSDGSDVEFVKVPTDCWSEIRGQAIASDSDFRSSIEVEIFRLNFHPAVGRRSGDAVCRRFHRAVDLFEDRVSSD